MSLVFSLVCIASTQAQVAYEAEEFVDDSDLKFAVKEMQKSEFIGSQIACEMDSPEICDSAENIVFESYKGHVKLPIKAFTGIQHYTADTTVLFSLNNPQINRLIIDCKTGSSVQAIANGEVTAIFEIPGNETVVLIKHGSYRSVYGGVNNLSVHVGDLVEKGQSICEVSELNNGQLVFEIWKSMYEENTALPVEYWIDLN